MKLKLLVISALPFFLIKNQCSAQNNYFPTPGNVGINVPSSPAPFPLTFGTGASTGIALYNTTDMTIYERAKIDWSGSVFRIMTENTSANARNMRISAASTILNIGNNTGTTNSGLEVRRDGTGIRTLFCVASAGLTANSLYQYAITVLPTINQNLNGPSTAGYQALFISPYEQTLGTGQSYLINAGLNTAGNGSGTHTAKFVVTNTGNVGIGTATPAEALSVNGTIRSKVVKVDANNWPDYVFKPNYSLPSLSDVKAYIQKNQHLPDMPSEQAIMQKGQDVGEINKILTKKVEELTLYLIEKDAKQKELEQRLEKLEKLLLNTAPKTK